MKRRDSFKRIANRLSNGLELLSALLVMARELFVHNNRLCQLL